MKPTDQDFFDWKVKYGTVMSLELEGIVVYYRTLTPAELVTFQELQAAKPDSDWDLIITRAAVLYPTDPYPQFRQVGSDISLVNAIMDSGIQLDGEGKVDLSWYKNWLINTADKNLGFSLAVLIANNYPSIDILQLLNTPLDKLLKLAATIEHITGVDLMKPKEDKQEKGRDPVDLLREQITKEKRNA